MFSRSRHHPAPQRRLFLKGLASLPLALPFASAQAGDMLHLSFRHTHTDERLSTAFRNRRGYIEPAIKRMNWLFRDFRTGEVAHMDPRLYDILHALSVSCGGETFEIISGYRSPKTNAMLRKTGGGVAKRSLHMEGKAIDIRLPGVPLTDVRDAAMSLRRGGVGYYQRDQFVHVDIGRVRHW